MELLGKIKLIADDQKVSDSFVKREMVLITNEQFPQHVTIEFTQDNVDLLDKFEVGEDVKISINILGREWKSPQGEVKHFNTIRGWRIEKI